MKTVREREREREKERAVMLCSLLDKDFTVFGSQLV